ncbi:filamentous hemagglutinin N-terminal domain-containing protein [Mitsuaria sp. GD03876]|uniref:two-partner secretion domain-containing protein n=1 Tax=Mitsuaria sp. GD03876 TaxID=2975399 RepID=UPI002446E693|nr:filamentous hemagglutinin N-terminal domain-containing protein [Mitsuaria sp. GD03876]MDH0866246.1 filamentous hemagglutinin N-terminal domain-containing protein [Mitsuaria sp. GD03876]
MSLVPVPLRGLAAAALLACLPAGARAQSAVPVLAPLALPEGAMPHGADVRPDGAGRLRIVQSAERAAIEWRRFDIGQGAAVLVDQQAPHWVLVNRVTGGAPSQLHGGLQAKGQVFLLNEQGVTIGSGARIEVGGLAVSTLRQTDGWQRLDAQALAAQRGDGGAIRHGGTIRVAEGGVAVFNGAEVALNGSVTLPGGHLLAHGGKVAVGPEARVDAAATGVTRAGSISISAKGDLSSAGVLIAAAEKAHGGKIRLSAGHVTLAGQLAADSERRDGGELHVEGLRGVKGGATMHASGGRSGGSIEIAAGTGALTAKGRAFKAEGKEGRGGTIALRGSTLDLKDITVNANGATAGGSVSLRADSAALAAPLRVWKRSEIVANATVSGPGGQVSFISAGAIGTDANTQLRVKGAGPAGVPGTLSLLAKAGSRPMPFMDFGAGRGGTLQLGARNWEIDVDPKRRSDLPPDADSAPARVSGADLSGWLDAGRTVELRATGRIEVKQHITTQAMDAGALTLNASDITLRSPIARAAGDVRLVLTSTGEPGGITMTDGVPIDAPTSRVSFETSPPNPDGSHPDDGKLTLGVVRAAQLHVDVKNAGVNVVVADKTYDGTTAATVSSGSLVGIELLPTSNLRAQVVAEFVDKQAGDDKVAIASAWLWGFNGERRIKLPFSEIRTNAGDTGTRISRSWETVATIHPLRVPVTGVAPTKTYDGTRAARVDLTVVPLPGDEVVVTHGGAEFDNALPGEGKTVTVRGLRVAGRDGGNYATPDLLTLAGSIEGKVIDPVRPVVEPVTPVIDPVTPVIEPVRPVIDPVMPVIEPVRPVVDPVMPVIDPVRPVVDPVTPAIAPVTPVVDRVAPTVHPAEPAWRRNGWPGPSGGACGPAPDDEDMAPRSCDMRGFERSALSPEAPLVTGDVRRAPDRQDLSPNRRRGS